MPVPLTDVELAGVESVTEPAARPSIFTPVLASSGVPDVAGAAAKSVEEDPGVGDLTAVISNGPD